MKKTLFLIIIFIFSVFLFNSGNIKVNAATADFTEDTILDLSGLTETLYIEAGSIADSLTISGGDLSVSAIFADPGYFSLKTLTHPVLKLTSSGGTADLSLSSSDFFSGYIYQWTENSSVPVDHVVGVPDTDTLYSIAVDGSFYGNFNSGALAEITFTRTGSGSSEVFTIEGVAACNTHNVWGWAWSENIGWLSFSCKDTGSPVDYGVDIEPGTYSFSGHAWSENIGWVSFNRTETGAPPGKPDFGTHLAEVDIITGEVSGWARVLAFGDGWDGWIKFRGPVISNTGLVASWSMDENSGIQILDSSGNDRTGDFGLDPQSPTWALGKYNTGLEFDGQDDYVSFSPTNTRTQEGWFYFTQLATDKGSRNHLFDNFYQHPDNNYFYFNGTNDLIFRTVAANTWYHLVLTYTDPSDTNTARFYTNGVFVATTTQQIGPHNILGVSQISRNSVSYAFKGFIDEVRLYDRVLTDEEIMAHYKGYGVDIDKSSGEFSNYAWSDMVLGWTSFNCLDRGVCAASDYKVQTSFDFNRAPQIQNPSYSSPTTCSYEMSIPIFSWDYLDEDDVPLGTDPQTAYQIRIDNDSTFEVDGDDNPILDADEYRCSGLICEVTTPVHSFSPQPAEWIAWTSYGQTYYWKARVKDLGGRWSDWSSALSFSTQAHPYPEPDFSYGPEIIVVNEDVNFIDLSVCYDALEVSYPCKDNAINSYAWDFNNDSIVDSTTRGDVVHQYTASGNYVAVLEITDDVGTCDFQDSLSPLVPLPEYKEVPPTSYFGGLFADVLQFFKNLLFS